MKALLAHFFLIFLLVKSISAFEITIRTVDFVGNQRQKIDYNITDLQGTDSITDIQNKFFQQAIPTEVKERLQEYINTDNPFLYFLGKILKTQENLQTKTLADYSISGGAILYCPDLTSTPYITSLLKYPQPKEVSITIVPLEDQTNTTQITIHNLKTIADLKEEIRKQKNMAIDVQQLVFKTDVLKNENSLYSYGIKNDDTIVLQQLYQTNPTSKLKSSLKAVKKTLQQLHATLSPVIK